MVVASVMVSVIILRIQLYLSVMILLLTAIMYRSKHINISNLEYFKRTIKIFHWFIYLKHLFSNLVDHYYKIQAFLPCLFIVSMTTVAFTGPPALAWRHRRAQSASASNGWHRFRLCASLVSCGCWLHVPGRRRSWNHACCVTSELSYVTWTFTIL